MTQLAKSERVTNLTVILPPTITPHTLFNKYKKILQRAKIIQGQSLSEIALAQMLGLQNVSSLPIAAICALGNDLPAQSGRWLRVDPVELLVDAGNIFLVGNQHLNIDDKETQQLIADLNKFLVEENLQINRGSSCEWFMQLPDDRSINTHSLKNVLGHDIRDFLPHGDSHAYWCKLLTELQMLLFQHPVNQCRGEQNKALINSVWFWGEGEISESYSIASSYTIFSHSSFMQGLSKLSQQSISLHKLPQKFSSCNFAAEKNYLICLDDPYTFEQNRIFDEWLDPIIESYKSKQLHELRIVTDQGMTYILRTKKKWFTFLRQK